MRFSSGESSVSTGTRIGYIRLWDQREKEIMHAICPHTGYIAVASRDKFWMSANERPIGGIAELPVKPPLPLLLPPRPPPRDMMERNQNKFELHCHYQKRTLDEINSPNETRCFKAVVETCSFFTPTIISFSPAHPCLKILLPI